MPLVAIAGPRLARSFEYPETNTRFLKLDFIAPIPPGVMLKRQQQTPTFLQHFNRHG